MWPWYEMMRLRTGWKWSMRGGNDSLKAWVTPIGGGKQRKEDQVTRVSMGRSTQKKSCQWEVFLFCLFDYFCTVKWRTGNMKTVDVIIKTIKDLEKGVTWLFSNLFPCFSNFLFCCHWSLYRAFETLGLNWKKRSSLQSLYPHVVPLKRLVNDSKD